MMDTLIMAGIAVVVIVLVVLFIWLRRRPRRIKAEHFQAKWHDMQKLCANKDTWSQAIIEADKLLDEVLKKKRFSGKTMGERLTHAQRLLSNNEDVWFGHKLRSKLYDNPKTKLKEADVKQALVGIRQALKDLGALPDAHTKKPEPALQPEPRPQQKPQQKPKQQPVATKQAPKIIPRPEPKPRPRKVKSI